MIDSGWASVIVTILLAIIGALAYIMRMVYDIRNETVGTKARLDQQDKRLDAFEANLESLSNLVRRMGHG